MSKIHIVNWLLTRKCNLSCDYCAIVRNYKNKPKEYPDMKYYYKNEMTTEYIINCLKLFKKHNPEIFNIFYGGEPTLQKDLPEIINFCNDNDIHYTIISNNTAEIQPLIKNLFEKTDYIQGFTSSIDPVFNSNENMGEDRVLKSIEGFKRLKEIKDTGLVKDVVAEITVMKHNVQYLYELVKSLSDVGINSDITFIDIAKNPYYDFANISNPDLLVTRDEAFIPLKNLIKSDFNIHMKDKLLPKIYKSLPSNMDCEIEKNLHNITIDVDGTLRLCLRIRGIVTPQNIMAHELFAKDNIKQISPLAHMCIAKDKEKYCELCNHTCMLHSQLVSNHKNLIGDLIHLSRRK
ncbi:MAG: radical SAM protein [Candidatus Helarchaeota archaeon]